MKLPVELWANEDERQLVSDLVAMLENHPVILTDGLANTIWFSPAAEELFRERAEAIVNRLSFSLLGFGDGGKLPPGLEDALLGKANSWRGVVIPEGRDVRRFVEISCIKSPRGFVCGVIRLSHNEGEV